MKNSQEGTAVRQNSKYTSTKKHAVNLRRNLTVHFQIGLILALIGAIFLIEMRSPTQALRKQLIEPPQEEFFTIDQVQVEKKIVKQPKTIVDKAPKPTVLDKEPVTKDDPTFVETYVDASEPTDEPLVNPDDVAYVDIIETPEPTIFSLVEQVPIFPGCEGLDDNQERRDCMSSKISKFVMKKFNTSKAEDLGLKGVNRIFVTFQIDVNGKVAAIQARAPHKKLEEEASRVAGLLPDMTPGKQGGKNVPVLFSLPITFKLQ